MPRILINCAYMVLSYFRGIPTVLYYICTPYSVELNTAGSAEDLP